MEIIFFNTFGIGDLFFNKPFLEHICRSNPERKFKINANYGSFFFKDISNLQQLDEEDLPLHHPKRYALFKFFESLSKQLFVEEDNMIFVNTWVDALNKLIPHYSCECNPVYLNRAFHTLVELLNTKLEKKLEFPPMKPSDFIYKMPSFPLELFLRFKEQTKKEILFYFNRMGMSASSKPFTSEDDHIFILDALSRLYPEKVILVPNCMIRPHASNILTTEMFGSVESHTCENVLFDMELAGHSTFAILFDVGAAYTYCNTHFRHYTAKFYHLSKESTYCFLSKQALETCLEEDTSRVEYVKCSTPEEVIQVIQEKMN